VTLYSLHVFDGPEAVGALGYESLEEQFSFVYADSWRRQRAAYSISPHILLFGSQSPVSGTVRRFLENLLPEGRALEIVTTTHQIARNNIYGLIRVLGQETSGALSFSTEPVAPHAATARREITREEFAARMAERADIPMSVWDGRVRLSIAGYQDKLAVYIEGERMFLVEGALASTHILKPEPARGRLPMLVANEHFCMHLAGRLGLSVANTSLQRLPDPVLIVERYDRLRQPDGVRRLHAIDSCQGLDLPATYKYERNFGSGRDVAHIRDGVSFERLFSLSAYAVRPAVTRLHLLRWALLQFLLGNSDAHGKNVSFFCSPDGLTLAPFYDMVSIVQYDELDHELAMAYGDEFRADQIRPYDWALFAERTGTARSLLAREMRRMGTAAAAAAPLQLDDSQYSTAERNFLEGIAAHVNAQARKLIDMATPMLAVKL
jgi:serine/threonine-protein kinase HipA